MNDADVFSMTHKPFGRPELLRNATVPVALLHGDVGLLAGPDGLVSCDIAIADGRVAAITPAGQAEAVGAVDLRGGQVWPLLIDVHTHLDKGHVWARAANPDGTHGAASRAVAQDRERHWGADDLRQRFDFGLRCAYAHGTGAIRTHIDSYALQQAKTSWSVFAEMARAWRGRVALQGVCMSRLDMYAGADGLHLAEIAAGEGGLLGGILRIGQERHVASPEALDAGLDRLFHLARDLALDIDLHIDETGDPEARTLAQVARAALRNRFAGKVTCGHCCSLAVQPEDVARDTIALVRDAGLNIVSLPMVNLYLQGRAPGVTPRWRGITLVHELAAAGVPVAVASDNCRDPFYAFGDHDMLEVYREFVRIAHADAPDWLRAVLAVPGRIMGLEQRATIAVGRPADLILFKARTHNEMLSRPQHDRIVLRGGATIDTTLPDYRELDTLPGTGASHAGEA